MSLVLAADVGTTGIKAGVIDERGRVLAFGESQNRLRGGEPGAAEHDPEELYRGLIRICRKTSRKLAGRIGTVALSGYQLGLLVLDESRRPLTGIMTLLDTRPQETFADFVRRCDAKRLYSKTGCPPFALYPLSRLFWLRRTRPGLFRRARYFAGGKDYLLMRLTGTLATEASTSSATQMLDIRRRTWYPYALDLAGLRREMLPELVSSDEALGPLRPRAAAELGLRPDVKVVPGVYDAAALVIGIGASQSGIAAVNLGTTAMLRAASLRPVLDDPRRMRLQTYCLDKSRWLAGAGINNAGNVRAWLMKALGLGGEARFDSLAARAPCGAKGLNFLPFLTGERDPRIGGLASGSLLGLKREHGPAELARAALEGVCCAVRLVRDALAEKGVAIREVRAGGGGARSRLWIGILADMLGVPVVAPGSGQPALVGSAMLGFKARGRYADLKSASARMVRPGRRVRPDGRNAAAYEKVYAGYLAGIARLYGKPSA